MERLGPSSASNWEHIKLHVIRDTPELIFEIDEYLDGQRQFLLAHIVFRKFTPSVLKAALKEWKIFRSVVTAPLYAVRNDGDVDKWERFVSLFDFKPTGIRVPCNSGNIRQVYISTTG